MTKDEMERLIYDAYIAGYEPTPALRQNFRIRARLAASAVMGGLQAERVASERARREYVRELAKLPLRERLKVERGIA